MKSAMGLNRPVLDRIGRDLVRVRSTARGGVISTPVLFPSGAHVTVSISLDGDRCMVTDDGAGYAEAEMMGAADVYRRVARSVAEDAGVRFNDFEVFESEASVETAAGMIAIIADASRRSVEITAERLARRLEAQLKISVVDRLREVFGSDSVTAEAHISGSSTHGWTVDALVQAGRTIVAVDMVSPSPNSVSAAYIKLDDIRRLDDAPRTVAALTRRAKFASDQLLILGRTSRLIDMDAGPAEYHRLAA